MSSILNRQPAPRNETAVEMLREKHLKKYSDVYTSDDEHVGVALRLQHRKTGIDPDLKYYASYLEVTGYELGNQSYIPTDFIKDYDPEAGKVTLVVKMSIVEDETWNRMPEFIMRRENEVEELPE